jgi:hypothetical protein
MPAFAGNDAPLPEFGINDAQVGQARPHPKSGLPDFGIK